MPNSNRLLREGFLRYYYENKDKKKPQSIKRESAKTIAAINYKLKNIGAGYKLDNIFSDIDDAPSNKKSVLEKAHRIHVVLNALQEKEKPHLAAIALLMMQTGAMFSEIQRLDAKTVQKNLKGPLPVVVIGEESVKTKTEERRRIVPIVFGAEYVINHIAETVKFLNTGKSPTTNASHLLKKYINKTLNTEGYSAHCFRHTLAAAGVEKNIQGRHLATICGWSGKDIGLSKHALNYGAEYLMTDEGLLQVKDSALKLHQEILTAIDQHSDPNIVPISKAK